MQKTADKGLDLTVSEGARAPRHAAAAAAAVT